MIRKYQTHCWAMVACALLLVPVAAVGQSATGSIEGRVVDENGTPLPGVTATAQSPAMQGQKTAATDGNGQFRLVALPPGSYQVTFSLDGFQDVVQEDLRVGISSKLPLAVLSHHVVQ